ncbi:teichuronic acid biosynthesis glycosyltransferase TuaC [Bathymodiolus japonicus methanotrophic gill symbiont]|uniref:glycosyltransferase n=1 Tax=Bathymodiolus japonicus methanotrophic gill symbiont TaxID=113269 RepID=UPI001B553ABE|nr:glycosyltransferase [Bathymodiolus japonicus methanotrophic gill symbiont]GFO71902.1 teichuronic acid biosynthesis glycosyltransferase TuaC [Bathymodiolus japonicus methanotrophic gill symbiont]
MPNVKAHPLLFIQVPFFLLSQFVLCYRLVKKLKPALIHAHWVFPQGSIASLIGRLTNTPVIITAHGGDAFALQGSLLNRIKLWSLRNCFAWTSNTSATANTFLGNIAQPEIIPMGIDCQRFGFGNALLLRSELAKGTTILLFVGRLVKKKGVEDLLSAYALLSAAQKKQTQLWIIGDGSERKALEELSRELDIDNKLRFWGKLPNEQLPDYYAAADIFIAPSIMDSSGDTEGQGVTLVEAMASGTAIISTYTGGISEVIEHDHTGILVAPQAPLEIKAAIIQLLEDSKLREKMAEQGKHSAQKYAWSRIGHSFQALYNQVKTER